MKLLTATFLCFASTASAQTTAEIVAEVEADIQRMRDLAAESGDVKALAGFALNDFSEAAGNVDGCKFSDNEPRIEDMAQRYGEWVHPGFFEGLSGSRASAADRVLTSARMVYSTQKYVAISGPCDRMTLQLHEMGLDIYAQAFDRYLDMPVNE